MSWWFWVQVAIATMTIGIVLWRVIDDGLTVAWVLALASSCLAVGLIVGKHSVHTIERHCNVVAMVGEIRYVECR